jgi:hypothetical protein
MSIFQNMVFYKNINLIKISVKEETKTQRGEVPCPRPRLLSAGEGAQTELPPSQSREDDRRYTWEVIGTVPGSPLLLRCEDTLAHHYSVINLSESLAGETVI